MKDSVYYFAYGSNLHPGRLQARLGEVDIAGICRLSGWRLVFNKRGEDDSAKANIMYTGQPGNVVWCALYRLPRAVLPELDRYETRGYGYDRVEFRLPPECIRPEPVEALSVQGYISPPQWQAGDWLPFDWYLGLVETGARYHDFPAHYVQALSGHASMPDPDAVRASNRQRLVASLSS